jgi:hypothetical protein
LNNIVPFYNYFLSKNGKLGKNEGRDVVLQKCGVKMDILPF